MGLASVTLKGWFGIGSLPTESLREIEEGLNAALDLD